MSRPRGLGRRSLRIARLLVAALIVLALAAQLTTAAARDGFSAINFFSYFTVLSNLGAALVLVLLAARGSRTDTAGFVGLRGAVSLYMGVTGLVYAVLLAPASADVGLTVLWVDVVLHEVAPVAVVLDWFLDRPRRPLPRSVLGPWLVFPAAYLAYSLVRGSITGWSPYPFLDPGAGGGYSEVAVYSAAVLIVIVAAGAVLRRWTGPVGSTKH